MIRHSGKLLLLALTLTFFHSIACFAADSSQTPLTGQLFGQMVSRDNKPLSNARLFIYNKADGPPSSDRYVRVPDGVTYLDSSGKFLLNLPPGTYYLSAINVNESAPMGPPSEGEPVYFRMDNNGAIEPFIVVAGKETNVGVISSSAPFKRALAGIDKVATLIEGVITDDSGKSVEGAVILADIVPGTQRKALYVSERTAKDGRFILRVSEGGEYFLRVRSDYHGGMPNEGDIINFNDPKEQVPVIIKKGEKLSGINIKVKRQAKKGPLFQGAPPSQ